MALALFISAVLYAKDPIIALTHENYKTEVLEHEIPIVVLYSPSSEGLTQFSAEETKALSYTYRAFQRSAKHFSGRVRFAYFDLQACLEQGWSYLDANSHLQSSHTLVGYPTVILYNSGEKEITRLETGIPSPKAIQPYVRALDFLVQKDIIEQSNPPYILNTDGRII